jgi:hypothetical protein
MKSETELDAILEELDEREPFREAVYDWLEGRGELEGTQVDYYIDGTLVRTETTNLPTNCSYRVGIEKPVGSTERLLDVDFIYAYGEISR